MNGSEWPAKRLYFFEVDMGAFSRQVTNSSKHFYTLSFNQESKVPVTVLIPGKQCTMSMLLVRQLVWPLVSFQQISQTGLC